ncbi:MAG: hypothetical protein PXZ08_12325, partial [Actinomycetota bacterium]|nr:hypothetical protein [Actinomycetota bacterium]
MEQQGVGDRARRIPDGGGSRRLRRRRFSRTLTSLSIILAPLTVLGVATSSAQQLAHDDWSDIVVSAPAVLLPGADDSYSVNVSAPAPFVMPTVSDGVNTDTFRYEVEGPNAPGCSLNADGTDFAYQSSGQCTVEISPAPAVNEGDGGDGGDATSATIVDHSFCAEDCAEVASLTVNIVTSPPPPPPP